MNTKKTCCIPAVSALAAMLSLAVMVNAEVRSGFWVHISPSSAVNAVKADFSEFTPFCAAFGYANSCSLKVADVDFSFFSSVKAPGGIRCDSALGAAIQAEDLGRRTITLDREGLFYLDSMMKKRTLAAPATAYADSCHPRQSVYFLKTSEGGYAAMIKVGEYIGGIDRTSYYWAYQMDDHRGLHKTALCEQPESLSITLDVFSGRPNPVFVLTDSAGIAEIVRQVYLSVNTLLDSSIKRTMPIICPSVLGYRKMSVTGMYGPDMSTSTYMPSLDICNAGITYYKVAPYSSAVAPRYLDDPGQRLEKTIVRVCCRLGLTATDTYGTVAFCDLVPDSLKETTGATRNTNAMTGTGIRILLARGGRVFFSVSSAGVYALELFDTQGRRLYSVKRRYGPGEYAVELYDQAMGAGVRFVRLSKQHSPEHACIPLITD